MAKRKRLSFGGPLAPAASDHSAPPPIAGVVADASTQSALAEMADTLNDARESGRMLVNVPLDQIALDYLVRDRLVVEEDALEALKASLKARGQQAPIEVTRLDGDRYGLISGWRRCTALAQLYAETGDPRFAEVQALLRRPADAPEAYCAMVEENEIRVGLSYYERARITARSVDQGVFPDTRAALAALFASASKAKRSKIGTFVHIVTALDGALRFPAAIGERFGLTLGRALAEDPRLGPRLTSALSAAEAASPEAEAKILTEALGPPAPPKTAPLPAETLCPGVEMTRAPNGSVVLSGPRVDDALVARLRGFLSHDKGA